MIQKGRLLIQQGVAVFAPRAHNAPAFVSERGSVVGTVILIFLGMKQAKFHRFLIEQSVIAKGIVFGPGSERRTSCAVKRYDGGLSRVLCFDRVNPAAAVALLTVLMKSFQKLDGGVDGVRLPLFIWEDEVRIFKPRELI